MVEVTKDKKEKKDPLDTIAKLTSIGTSIAGMASKAGGEKSAMDRRFADLESEHNAMEEINKSNDYTSDNFTMKKPKPKFGL